MALSSVLRSETPLLEQQVPQRAVRVPWAAHAISNQTFSFTLQGVGGVVFACEHSREAPEERGLHWQIENGANGALHLTELSVHHGATSPRVSLETSSQLFPGLAVTGIGSSKLLVAALLGSGHLMYVELPVAGAADVSALTHLQPSSIMPLDLSGPLSALGTPTSLAASPEAILIGAASGSVLCVPLGCLADNNTARCFELRDNSWNLTKLIPGVIYGRRQPAALACLPVTVAHRHVLLVAYDDCMLRVFNLARRAHITSLDLDPPAAALAALAAAGGALSKASLTPTFVAACGLSAAGGAAAASDDAVAVVVQLEARDTLQRCTCAFTLTGAASSRLSLSAGVELSVEAGAAVADARVSGETAWLMLRVQGRTKVCGYNRTTGALVSAALLQEATEAGPSEADATSSGGAVVEQVLWNTFLRSFPPGEGEGAVDAGEQICARMLLPGQLCRVALREALSYHGAQLSSSEVEGASFGVLKGYMQAAVLSMQRRSPAEPLASAWRALLAAYQSAWARRHVPLGLALHPTVPTWLACVRGDAALGVLRQASAVEAIAAAAAGGSTPRGRGSGLDSASAELIVAQLPAQLQTVHACVAEAAALVGSLAQEAFLAALTAGSDPQEQLLPRYVDLWLQGPPSTSGGGAAASAWPAALTDSAQEAAHMWRRRRQHLLLSIGQRLGSLSNPLAALQSYIAQLRLLTTQAAADMSGAAAAAAAAAGATAGGGPSKAAASYLNAACRQAARAMCCAVRDTALLLGLMLRQAALGTTPLERLALIKLEAQLLPDACGLLRRGALAMWLTAHAASQGDPSDMEPALSALEHLKLGADSAAGAAGHDPVAAAGAAAVDAGRGPAALARDSSLAVRLLPALCRALAVQGARDRAAPAQPAGRSPAWSIDLLRDGERMGLAFAMYLQYGDEPEAAVPSRVLQLGYQLFMAREYVLLPALTRLAGSTGSQEAGAQFLRGLGLTCSCMAAARQQQRQPQDEGKPRSELVSEAAACFFRAAAGLAADSGGATLRHILSGLREALMGGAEAPPPPVGGDGGTSDAAARQRQELALLQLRFCEAVMLLFEREGAPEGAAMFAAAALEHLRAVYGPPPGSTAQHAGDALLPGEDAVLREARAQSDEARAQREGRLWSNVFRYACDMRDYGRAYAALVANPVPQRALACLRQLVHVLCEERQLQALCTLPFAGVVRVPSPLAGEAAEVVPLLQEVVAALQRRAHNSDLSAQPQPYKVLYDMLVQRNDFKGAARAMAAYAWRLRAEGGGGGSTQPAVVADALHAYGLAINCLALLDPSDAVLDLAEPWLAQLVAAPAGHAGSAATHAGGLGSTAAGGPTAGGAAGSGALFSVGAEAAGGGAADMDIDMRDSDVMAVAAQRRSGAFVAAVSGGGRGRGGGGVLPMAGQLVATVASLQRERTMLRYCAVVASRMPGLEPLRQWDNEEAILQQLLLMGRYQGALELVADCFGEGDKAVRAMEAVVAALASHCVRLQLQEEGLATGGAPLPSTDLFQDDLFAAMAHDGLGGRAAPLWAKLRSLLDQADSEQLAPGVGPGPGTGGGDGNGCTAALLHDAAVDAVLRADPRVELPQWLLDSMLRLGEDGSSAEAMGGHDGRCGPARLLAAYLRHDRLAHAVELVAGQVAAWSRTDVRDRRRHAAAWFPYSQLELVRTKLVIGVELGLARADELLLQLDGAVAAHLELVAADTDRIAPPPTHPPPQDAMGIFLLTPM